MDSRKDSFDSIVWDIELGSLVKIKNYDYTGRIYYHYGIVVGKKEICQIEMFPSVDVYTFETQIISKKAPNALQVLSRPSDEKNKTTLD